MKRKILILVIFKQLYVAKMGPILVGRHYFSYKTLKFPLRMLSLIQKCHTLGGLILESWQWTCTSAYPLTMPLRHGHHPLQPFGLTPLLEVFNDSRGGGGQGPLEVEQLKGVDPKQLCRSVVAICSSLI